MGVTPRLAPVLDAASIVAFAALGRASHDEGSAIGGTLTVAAPFLIGGAAGWAIGRGWVAPASARTGAAVWAGALVAGLILRNLAFDRGTPAAFAIVTALSLAVLLAGWRTLLGPRGARSARPARRRSR